MDTNESIPQVEINKRIIQRYFEAYNDEIISYNDDTMMK